MMRYRGIVTISRYWDNPKISTVLELDFIALRISLDSFVKALKAEIGPVTMVFRKKTFDERLDQAVVRVLSKIKEESTKVA